MAYNQTCILIQNCVGIGTDTPLGSLTVKQTSTDGGATGGISIINDNNELKGSLFAGGSAPRPYGHLLLRDASNNDSVMLRTTGASNFILCGNFGIGTSSPIGILEVRGASCLISSHGLLQVNSSTSVGIDLGGSLSFGGVYQSTSVTEFAHISGRKETATSGEYGGYLDFATRPHLGLNTSRMRITSTGNVGIGITTPCGALDTYKAGSGGSGTGDNIILRGGNSASLFGSNQLRFGFAGGIGYSHAIKSRHQSGSPNNNALDFFIWTTADAAETTGTKLVMTLDGTGNVGMGTCSPAGKMHISHTAAEGACAIIIQSTNSCGNGTIAWRSSAGTTQGQIGSNYNVSDGAGNLEFITTSSTRLLITSTGKVAVGSTSPNGQLSVAVDQSVNNQHFNIVGTQTSYSQEYSFGIPTSTKDLRIYDGTAGAVRLTLTCLGNLGLNTTTPGAYKLNVNGAFYAAGSSCEYKTSICNYNTDSCMFMKLKPVTYQYKDEYCHLGKELKSGTQIGLIAEDTAEVFPELAILKEEENEKVVRNVDYEKLTIILLSELQKLRQEVDQLKNK